MRFKMLASEAVRSMTASLSTAFAATVTVLIGMFLVGVLIAFGTYADSWTGHQKKKLLVKVFFCTDQTCPKHGYATSHEINAVRAKLEANPRVKSVLFVSKEEALKEMQRTRPELTAGLPSNPLPDAETVRPVAGEDTLLVARSLYPLPNGVQKVCPPPPGVKLNYKADSCGLKATKQVLRAAHTIELVFLIAIVILLVASTLLIANTIRLSIFARRREIEVMKLVGASNWFVRGPFMVEGLLTGLLGSLAAVIVLLVAKEIVLPSIVGHLNSAPDVHAWAFPLNALILIGLGLLLGAAGSGFTIRRFLRV